jgi:hypothetical protein
MPNAFTQHEIPTIARMGRSFPRGYGRIKTLFAQHALQDAHGGRGLPLAQALAAHALGDLSPARHGRPATPVAAEPIRRQTGRHG